MPADRQIEKAKKQLGQAIVRCRGTRMSQRQLALAVKLPPSNMKYIEDGVNAPTRDVYEKLIHVLEPSGPQLRRMDQLYMVIRRTPPPDVCDTLMENRDLMEAVRSLHGVALTAGETRQIRELFDSFKASCATDA